MKNILFSVILSMAIKIKKLFFDPHPSVQPGLPQLRARLLSGLAFGFLALDILLTIRGVLTGGASFQVYVFGALVLTVFLISRTKLVSFVGIFWVISLSAILLFFDIQAYSNTPDRIPQGIGFTSLPIFLSLLLLPAKTTLGIALINYAGLIAFIQRYGVSMDNIILPLISSISFSVIAVIVAFILEKDRQDLVDINKKLQAAYEATLEGWAKALELKDRDTERHSKQVVNYTLEVARKLGLSEEEISHIRRGALLHDIGKMAIPDRILHKPGKLTDEEWEIMMQHPVDAYKFLSNIDYLRPALDIPRYHHERWDGTGYPYGLAGEEIPLSARIFSVVDVWDALNSDRPYRKAWSAEKTTAYLQEQAGKLFDPDIVLTFLKLLDNKKAPTE